MSDSFRKCNYCQVEVDSHLKRCPLCFKSLGEPTADENSLYPAYDYSQSAKRPLSIGFKLALFASIAGGGICTLVNLVAWPGYFWTIYVIAAILSAWLLVRNTVMSKKHGGFKILIQLVVSSALLFVIDMLSGQNYWSLNIVIPFINMGAITLIMIMVAVKQMLWSEYIGYALVIIFSGFAPLIFYLLGVSTLMWPSVVAAAYAGIAYLGMWIFRDKQLESEFKRRFHF